MRSIAIFTISMLAFAAETGLAQTLRPVEPKALCLWSNPLPDCRSFLLTEAHARYRLTGSAEGQSRFYLTGELGWMRNLDESRAIGVGAFGGYDWDNEITRGGLKARYRRWLGGSHRVDFSAGGFLSSAEQGGVGLVAGVEYALVDALLLTLEVDYAPVERHLHYRWDCFPETDYSECRSDRATSPTVFLGFGLGRKPGVIVYAAATALGILAAGMSDFSMN